MTNTQHTPAPWFAAPDAYYDEHANVWKCSVYHNQKIIIIATGGSPIEAEANARLIAASPKLLEALKRLLWEWDCKGACTELDVKNARAIVAKAKGE